MDIDDLDELPPLSRRSFLRYALAAGTVSSVDRLIPGHRALAAVPLQRTSGSGQPVQLTIGEAAIEIGGRSATATAVNGVVPGPILRFREGDEAVIHVTNELRDDTSIHWHGIILPFEMDGVPGVTFDGIRPGETFTYRFPVRQSGTYWYHSHSGLQEQLGHYGALIIDPDGPEPEPFDREYVIVLSDWTFEDPHRVMSRLKKDAAYYNFNRRTVGDFIRDAREEGLLTTASDRLDWGAMRMDPTDISDVTGAAYTYLLNGQSPESGWTGLFEPGERVRLRFINAGAATHFDVRVPGLPMRVIQVSGQHVEPVEVDEFRIGIAETYDVIVTPNEATPYAVFAEAMDRSGYAFGILATEDGMSVAPPERRTRPVLSMADMGMMHGAMMDMGDEAHVMPAPPADAHDHSAMPMANEGASRAPGAIPEPTEHAGDDHGSGNASIPMMTQSRLHEPGIGLGNDGRRVLTYADLRSLEPNPNFAPPEREIELHLTGNMERFMWSLDGQKFSDSAPIEVGLGERFRLTMVNDTMMNHPMHLHGMWMELENGAGASIPRIHTINVKPAERVSLLVSADVPGPWAFHCHVLYHMEAGMFRVFQVGPTDSPARGNE